MDIILQSFGQLFAWQTLLWIFIGITIGIIFGSIPGLSGTLGIILFLPFTMNMSLVNSILFLTSIFCGGEFGGSISAILIGTPGTNSATCTMIEGYPLARRGFAKRALKVALLASVIGGTLSALTLLFTAPTLARFTLRFSAPEYFAIALFGLSIVISLSGKNLAKGLFACCAGIILSLIGVDAISGQARLIFSNTTLYRGMSLIALLTGMFALPNIIQKVKNAFITREKHEAVKVRKDDNISFKEFLKYKWVVLKGSIIGIVIGIIPGIGTGVASFISYNNAKNSSKHPEEYGKGSLEGIVAVESSNNGVTSASLIPLLTLGLPGSPSAAVLIGAFALKGLACGPMLFREYPTEIYAILIGLVLANLVMLGVGSFMSKWMSKITLVPDDIMVPILTVICAAGAYSVNNSGFDMVTFILSGIVAYLLMTLEMPVIPAVLGFVLGNTVEQNLRKGLVMTQGDFWTFVSRPITAVVLLLTIGSLAIAIYKEIQSSKKEKKAEQT